MFKFLKKFFDYNEKEIGRLQKVVNEINSLEDKARKLKDKDFAKETEKLKTKLDLTWGFALVREASRRVLGQRHYDVQLIAGLALYEGKIAEQKTGEGKTLSATTALYAHALAGKGAHLVTVNDYLTRRDAGWMGGIFHLLGMKTAAMIADNSFIFDPAHQDKDVVDWRLKYLRPISRHEAYQADITYGVNSEFGFDYLRDNMVTSPTELRQREYYYAVIDEADSILIDEARTPHIISAPYEKDTSKYYLYAKIVRALDPKTDYIVNEKDHTANLTEIGITQVEKALKVSNLYEKDFDTLFHMEAALKAETLYRNDREYIVRDGQVIIVDEFTGRLLEGRRFSEGIHQAIEAKENVAIQQESKTLATVSLQNYFRMYQKLAGMTGTAATEAEEFNKIYKTDVVVVPTHSPMIRKDSSDMIYKTEKAKFNAVVEEIALNYKRGRPILVGTTSIEKNERLSRLLKQKGIKHELLNAKNHEREAQIIEKAGEKGAVTVATNMAGRGVDIVLGKGVVDMGGFYVIGTERHESRRIDNQLRGRSGRQGDPGDSRFFVSLEDDLMRIFGGEQISNLMTFLKFPEDQPLTHSMVSKAIEQAQIKVEGVNFDIRKQVVEYDDVLNKQREIIYDLRKRLLLLLHQDLAGFKDTVFESIQEEINVLVNQHLDGDSEQLTKEVELIVEVEKGKIGDLVRARDEKKLLEYILSQIRKEYEKREKELGREIWNSIVQNIYLTTLDQFWTEHLTAMEDLRTGMGLRGYAHSSNESLLGEYRNEAFSMFERLVIDIHSEAAQRILRTRLEAVPSQEKKEEREVVYKAAAPVNPYETPKESPTAAHLPTSKVEEEVQPVTEETPEEVAGFKVIPPGAQSRKLGRNDPCWCGSGKKYKKCHYPN